MAAACRDLRPGLAWLESPASAFSSRFSPRPVPGAPPRTLIRNAALILTMDPRGSLTPGKKGDVIIIDPGTINFAPRFDWISQIVFNGQPANVLWVFVNGQALKARGKLVGVDPGPSGTPPRNQPTGSGVISDSTDRPHGPTGPSGATWKRNA